MLTLERMPGISQAVFRRICLANVVVFSAAVVTGGAVRLTSSGLGCPDWPACAHQNFVAAWQYHAMIEFTNRVFSIGVVVAAIAALVGAILYQQRRRDLIVLSAGLVAGVVTEAVLGGITVLFQLSPPLVMAHFLLALAVLWDALLLHHRAGQPATQPRPVVGRRVVRLARLVLVDLSAASVVGTIVTGSGPHSGSDHVARLPFGFQAVTEIHASLVWALLGLTLAMLFALRQDNAPPAAQRLGRVLAATILAQGVIGYAQYFTHVPALAVGFHIAGATAVWIAAIELYLGLFYRPDPDRPSLGAEGDQRGAEILAKA